MWWLLITGAMAEPNWNALKNSKGWQPYKVVTRKAVGQISVFIKTIDDFPCFKGESLVEGVSAEVYGEFNKKENFVP